jgi:hypothetical protein
LSRNCRVCELPYEIRKSVDRRLQCTGARPVQDWIREELGLKISSMTLERHYFHVLAGSGIIV